MNDGWQRPDAPQPTRPPSAVPIEVPLGGDGPLAERGSGDSSEAPPPNWRKIIWVSSLAGVALGILLSVVLLTVVWDDDEPDDGIAGGPSTTVDGLDLPTLITTPPTLGPVDGTPPVETAPRPPTTLNPPPTTLDLPTTTLAAPPEVLKTYGTLPDYPNSARIPEGGFDSYDLTTAVGALADDVARRSETHFETGAPENTLEVTIVRDPINDRYGLTLRTAGGTLEAVIDIDAGVSYVDNGDGTWTQWDNDGLLGGVSADRLGDFFDDLLFGPVRPDTIESSVVEPLTMVFFEGGDVIAREFAVELPGAVVPEWQYYAFGPTGTFPESLRPERLSYLAYVDQDGNLGRVTGRATIGDVDQLVIHQVERLASTEIVLTPDPSTVIVRPTVSA